MIFNTIDYWKGDSIVVNVLLPFTPARFVPSLIFPLFRCLTHFSHANFTRELIEHVMTVKLIMCVLFKLSFVACLFVH